MAKIRLKEVEWFPVYVEDDPENPDPTAVEVDMYEPFIGLQRNFMRLFKVLQETAAMDYRRAQSERADPNSN